MRQPSFNFILEFKKRDGLLSIFSQKNKNVLGTYFCGDKRIEVYLPAFSEGGRMSSTIERINKTITHEYIHAILDKYNLDIKQHHWALGKMGLMGL